MNVSCQSRSRRYCRRLATGILALLVATAALVNQGTRAVASGPIVRQGLEHAIS